MLGRRGRPLLWQALVTEQKPITRLQRAASSVSALKPPGEWRERSILPTHRIFWKRWEAPPQTPNLNADPRSDSVALLRLGGGAQTSLCLRPQLGLEASTPPLPAPPPNSRLHPVIKPLGPRDFGLPVWRNTTENPPPAPPASLWEFSLVTHGFPGKQAWKKKKVTGGN